MEQHPIPQNITNFEFKLIGDMTIKQFAYLAGCTVFAYLAFITPIHPFIKFPVAVFSAILGVALAFLPVEGRPLDRWIASFIKALFAPSQYIFHKDNQATDFFKTYTSTVKAQIPTLKTPTARESDERFTTFLQQTQVPLAGSEDLDQKSLARIQKLEEETELLPHPSLTPPTPLASPKAGLTSPTPLPAAPKEPSDMEKKLQEALAEREQLLKELEALKLSAAAQSSPKFAPPPAPSEPEGPTASPAPRPAPLFTVPPKQPKSPAPALSPFPQAPNIVAGVVKDSKDDVLPNIIVEVKDSSGSPLRAFKTNKLGQFFASTPLSNGQYVIELEDPKNTYLFDQLSVNLTGVALVPLEIKARDPAVNERLKLHAALFGNKTTNN